MLRPISQLAGLTAAAFMGATGTVSAAPSPGGGTLRVCADPNNLPFSNREEAGFENKLAELVAKELGSGLEYKWWPQRWGFVRKTLKTGACDVIMGVPANYEPVETTRPYYRSAYVFVSRSGENSGLKSLRDTRLRNLRIGVQLIGDDGMNTPPAHALAKQGIVTNVRGYPVYGDYGLPFPEARIFEDVERGKLDVASVWGPVAGYYARHSQVPLTVSPIADGEAFAPLKFTFAIAMGVRHGDHAFRARLDEVIARKEPEILALLSSYGVPLVQPIEEAALAHTQEKTQ